MNTIKTNADGKRAAQLADTKPIMLSSEGGKSAMLLDALREIIGMAGSGEYTRLDIQHRAQAAITLATGGSP